MRRAAAVLAVVAFAVSGCANGFVCARSGGPRWRELTTEHFVLRTDHGPEIARALALELEQLRDAVAAGLLESVPKTGARVVVVKLKWRWEWALFSPSPLASGLFTTSRWGEPTIVLPADLGPAQRMVIAHEIAHMLTATDHARQPLWYREGLASYAETVEFRGEEANVTIGDVSSLRVISLPPFDGYMRGVLAERDGFSPTGYALAWALVHFLVTEHSDRLAALEERFGRGEDPMAAWKAVFPEWNPDAPGGQQRLEDALTAYTRRPAKMYVLPHRRLERIPPPAERMLSPAEVHDVRLSLPWPNEGRRVPRAQTLAEAREALAEDPGTPAAVALLSGEPGADPRALAEAATRARPGDPRTWILLGDALPADDARGREAAFRKAVDVDPGSAPALLALAAFLVEHGRAREAFAYAKRCVELAPWSAVVLDRASAVLEALGDCRGALALQERAIDALSDDAPAALRKALAARRDRLRGGCGEDRARPAPTPASNAAGTASGAPPRP